MAPTICSDKKTQIRTGIKDIRKQSTTTSSLSTSPSSAINYAQKRSKLLRPYLVRGKQSADTFRHHSSSSSDVSSSDDTNERFLSRQSPVSSMSDNSISTSSESSLLSPLSLSSFPSPSTAALPAEACLSCAERLNPFYHNSDSTSVFSENSNQDNNIEKDDDDEISRSSSVITSDSSQSTVTTTIITDKSSVRAFSMLQQQQQQQAKNTKGLFEIAIKTIKLVRRNQLLQRRLAQLQLETSEFIQSVLANPENRVLRNKMQAKSKMI